MGRAAQIATAFAIASLGALIASAQQWLQQHTIKTATKDAVDAELARRGFPDPPKAPETGEDYGDL